ncbi:MAG: 5-formyltetrahydrofolate cyclo-ligase [Betaproteobacteria bacterium]|nr:5-formyltetrahydrofolate cyclo-ligase [Betaproteobacteria bacterium]
MNSAQLAAWRSQLRKTLIERRARLAADQREDLRRRIDIHLQRAFPDLAQGVIGFCWPYRNEYDARHLLASLRRQGALTALPVVVAPKTPLEFREWHPGVKMQEGVLGIPFPVGTELLQPDTFLIPLVGFDTRGYRLGYGGAYFDRTLAALDRPARKVGVGYEMLWVETIHPQAHDVPMDYVVTERGLYRREGEVLRFLEEPIAFSSPPCYAAEIGNQPRNSR